MLKEEVVVALYLHISWSRYEESNPVLTSPLANDLTTAPPMPVCLLITGRKEGTVFFNDALNTFLFTVIWRQTYVKGPLR